MYVRRDGDERVVTIADADGAGETALTAGKGDFAQPHFSPQR